MATVYVGLSGGVDSAVSAALLKDAGHRVVGAFIKIWRPEFVECPWQRDRLDAMRVCAALGVPFREIDLSDEYKSNVIDDMIRNYERGVTPNPDVLCNRHIKFGAFAAWAYAEGAEYVATGHYAQTKDGILYRGADTAKDQSYFLWQLTAKDLARVMFPIGGYTKPTVRALAQKYNLPVATKADSQGLCFVGDVTMRDFLAHYVPLSKGAVLDGDGATIGEHDGAALYTIGMRHGFRIRAHSADEKPHYVVAIDTRANTITVSSHARDAAVREVTLESAVWNTKDVENTGVAQARYRARPIACTRTGDAVHFTEPMIAAPGQSLVVYEENRCIGGGIISRTV